MSNHPNRSGSNPSRNPTPSEIKEARAQAGITQEEAGKMLHTTVRVWQQWEAGDRRMHPAMWELFRIKAKLLPEQPSEITIIMNNAAAKQNNRY